MTAALTSNFAVTDDEMTVLAARLGVQALPVVLDLRGRHHTQTALAEAVEMATRSLHGRGLIRDGEVVAELGGLVQSLQRPDRELAMRFVTPDGLCRVSVVRKGAQCVCARRIGTDITLTRLEGSAGIADIAAAAKVLLGQLPDSTPADIGAVGAPLDQASQALSGGADAVQLADSIRALGAEPRTAMLLGSALSARQAFAEIVYYALDPDEDRVLRKPAAVGVFYTKRGRIVAAPSSSPSGQLWTTLKAGSDHAIKQAIGQLAELSGYRWGDC
ncbi:ESX secretion-associated protein EspG [Mycobacterium sp. 21AC1]|uniref:ESX secretion-associated protein EspG n=1 Tax=[Mycobacterium] appelbergii TaxID=2939269 RepID=UPI002938E753|nr:ESX secretion-associated protein EspG [Mycobacterium sp. 21AC1]MDV3124024.1 ESX secretion-associated protein EspG [Mycobacterium sp. 21AC1]